MGEENRTRSHIINYSNRNSLRSPLIAGMTEFSHLKRMTVKYKKFVALKREKKKVKMSENCTSVAYGGSL